MLGIIRFFDEHLEPADKLNTMKTPSESEERKSTQTSYQPDQTTETSKGWRSSFFALVLLALPVIFIVIALTKVLASEEYNPPLEKETISWRNEPLPVDTSFVDTLR
jgi:hypothetical protein